MFEPLDKHHNRTAFDCGQDDINRYLQTMASQHHKKGVARLHVLADGKTIMGFYTLANISIELDLKDYPRSTPAIMMGRMGVDNHHQGQGCSKVLPSHAIQSIKHISITTGVMVIVIDAKDERLAQYYEQFGFVPTANPLRLILNVRQI